MLALKNNLKKIEELQNKIEELQNKIEELELKNIELQSLYDSAIEQLSEYPYYGA